MRQDVYIRWEHDGAIKWQPWWVARHGHTRERIPGEDDHIGFANFDLSNNGCPRISRVGGSLVVQGAREESLDLIRQVMEYHGFVITRVAPSQR